MATANQELFDLTLQRQIAVRRMTQDVLNDVLDYLTTVDQDLVKKLKGDLTTFQKSRLHSLLKEVKDLRKAVWLELLQDTRLNLEQLAALEAAWEEQAIKRVIPIERSFASVNIEQVVASAMAKPFQGATMSQWFSDLATKDITAITRAISLGVTEGQTIDEMIRVIRGTKASGFTDGILSTSRRHAETIVRTATNHVSNAARNEVWMANSDIIRGLRWTATLDGRTSLICASRDGMVAPLGDKPLAPGERELTPPDARPPAHPNCRSLMVAVLDGLGIIGERPTVIDTRTPEKREIDFRRMAKEQGKSIQQVRKEWATANVGRTPAATNYEEWLRTQTHDFQNRVLGRSRAELFRKGHSIGDFVTSTGTPKKAADVAKAAAAPNVRQYIRRELLKGRDWKSVLDSAQKAYPAAGVTAQQVGIIRKNLQTSGMLSGAEVPQGTAQAVKTLDEFQNGLPPHISAAAPPGWADIVSDLQGAPPGLYLLHLPGEGVKLSGPTLGKMSKERSTAVYAKALGHVLREQAVGPLDSDLVTAIYKKAQSIELGPLGLNGEVLIDELFGLAIHPGALTSWGTQAGPFLIHFADEIKAIQVLLQKSLAPKKPVPPAAAASFPVTGHKTPDTYAKAMLAAGKSPDEVLAATQWYFPNSGVTEKTISAYKAQLAAAKKKAEMPSKKEVDEALKLAEDPNTAYAVKNKMAALSKGLNIVDDGTSITKAAKTLHKAMGSWAKVEAKLASKVKVQPVPAPGAVPLTAAEIKAAEQAYNALGPTSKTAVQNAVAHIKATGSMKDVENVLAATFGNFDPVKGKPLLELIQKLAGLANPPWTQAAQKAAKDALLKVYGGASSKADFTPSRPAKTPAEGMPPPPRFTEEQKRAAVLKEFGSITPSPLKELTDLEFTVIQQYTGDWYEKVNPRLAHPTKYRNDFQLQALVELAQEGLRKLPPVDGTMTLYRNIYVDYIDLGEFLNRYRVGAVLEEKRFTSTSTDGVFGKGRNVQLKFVQHRSGRDVDSFSLNKGEREVLFPPGTNIRVKSVSRQGFQIIVEVEEV